MSNPENQRMRSDPGAQDLAEGPRKEPPGVERVEGKDSGWEPAVLEAQMGQGQSVFPRLAEGDPTKRRQMARWQREATGCSLHWEN